MRANVNQNRLVRVQKILQDPTNFVSKLSPANRSAWNKLGAVNKGAFVNRLMNRPAANKPMYYFRSTHPFTNEKSWFNGKGTRINQPTNVNESKLIPSNEWTNSIWKAFEGGAAYASPINMNGNANSDPNWNAYVKNNI
jgi:hypothetical protein